MLMRKFYNCSSHVKKFLFKTYCTNFYYAQLWWTYSNESLRKIRVAFNNRFMYLMGYSRRCSASGMLLDNNVDDCNVLRRKYTYRFNCRLQKCNSIIIRNILMYKEFCVYRQSENLIQFYTLVISAVSYKLVIYHVIRLYYSYMYL